MVERVQHAAGARDGQVAAAATDVLCADAGSEPIARISLRDHAPEPDLCSSLDPALCIRLGMIPWQRLGRSIVIAIDDPARSDAILAEARRHWPDHRIGLVRAPRSDVAHCVERAFSDRLAARALTCCHEAYSCRGFGLRTARLRLGLVLLLAGIIAWLQPAVALLALLCWILVANSATLALRLTAILACYGKRAGLPVRPVRPHLLPRITVLLPVLREGPVIADLLAAMAALDYPRDRLEILMLMEADDDQTRRSLAPFTLPETLRVIEVPHDTLRTKPRAMNYALPLARGEVIGIYDAEDRPEPDQLRKVAGHLARAPQQVACVQARLDFYNADQNWLTRCFTLEYATWFRVLLHGVQALDIPLPLGGTSVFFRRPVLEEVGAWDAHNVTEDAELGMRLARYGYRCEMVPSTTYEEANSRFLNWIGQRSRWLKGYCMTWAAHMRAPAALLRDLGPRGFLGFQVLLLGAITAYLAIPLFWAMTALAITGTAPGMLDSVPDILWFALWISLPAGQFVMLTAVLLALRDRNDLGRMPWVLTLPVYWPLGAVAAWRAVGELFVAPFRWHKTQHGLTRSEQQRP